MKIEQQKQEFRPAFDVAGAHDFILSLNWPYSLEDLKKLQGMDIPILDWGWSWQKPSVESDRIVITAVHCQINAFTGDVIGPESVYSDYWRNGELRFNAWTSIGQIKKSVSDYRENKHGLVSGATQQTPNHHPH